MAWPAAGPAGRPRFGDDAQTGRLPARSFEASYRVLPGTQDQPDEARRDHTSEFIRSASSRLLGINDGRGSPAVRQGTRRVWNRQQMEETVDAELMRRCFCLITIMIVILGVFFSVGVYFWVHAIIATLKYGDAPCDVPLGKYVWIQFGCWWIISGFRMRPQDAQTTRARILAAVSSSSVSGVVLVIGFVWVHTSKTCSQTNPVLFYAVEHLLYFQTAGVVLVFIFSAIVVLFLRWAVRTGFDPLGVVARQRGCEEEVRLLPQVSLDDPELLDPEDGRPSECVICSEEHSSAVGLAVVRTPCGHHFHEACLARWCRNHTSCPICRADVDASPADICDEPGGGP